MDRGAWWGYKGSQKSNTTEWLNNNNQRIHQAAPVPPTRKALRGVAPSRRFYRKKDGTRELSAQKSFPGGSAGKEFPCNAGDLGSTPGSERSPGEGIGYPLHYYWTSLVIQLVKNLPTIGETWVWSLDGEEPLEKGRLPAPVSQPGESPERYSPWSHKESDTTEQLALSFSFLPGHHFVKERSTRVFLRQLVSSSSGDGESPLWQITSMILTQKILNWLTKVKIKTAIRSGIKSRFGVTGFSTSGVNVSLWFFP